MATVKDILRTKGIIKADLNETLSTALAHLSGSHDASFVFADDDFLGVVNPFHALIQNRFPGSTKVEHALFHPPHVEIESVLEDIIHLFTESKVNFLPVFKGTSFAGIVSARDLVRSLYPSDLGGTVEDLLNLKKKRLITITEHDTLDRAVHLFKTHKVSKLVVVGEHGKLCGLLSHYDIIHVLMAPKQKPELGLRTSDKDVQMNEQVMNYCKSRVSTVYPSDPINKVLKELLDKKVGSVVVIDKSNTPVGIITLSDFLMKPESGQDSFTVLTNIDDIDEPHKIDVDMFMHGLLTQLRKDKSVQKVHIVIRSEKNHSLYTVNVTVERAKQKTIHISLEGPVLRSILSEAKNRLKKMNT